MFGEQTKHLPKKKFPLVVYSNESSYSTHSNVRKNATELIQRENKGGNERIKMISNIFYTFEII